MYEQKHIFVANRDWIICRFAVKLSTCNNCQLDWYMTLLYRIKIYVHYDHHLLFKASKRQIPIPESGPVRSKFTRALHSTRILWLSKMPWIFPRLRLKCIYQRRASFTGAILRIYWKEDTQQLHFTQQFRKDSLVKLSEIISSFNTAFFCREFNSTVHLPNVFTKDSELLPEGGPPRSSVKYLPAWGNKEIYLEHVSNEKKILVV